MCIHMILIDTRHSNPPTTNPHPPNTLRMHTAHAHELNRVGFPPARTQEARCSTSPPRHDPFIRETVLTHKWDMTHSHVGHDSFIRVTWLLHMWDMTHLYVRHDSQLPPAPLRALGASVSLVVPATHCNTLQHTATRCNTLQQCQLASCVAASTRN